MPRGRRIPPLPLARHRAVALALVLLLSLVATALPAHGLAAAPARWRDTGIDLPGSSHSNPESSLCVDPTRPNTIVVPQEDGAYAYDGTVGPSSRRRLNGVALRFCSRASGLIYGELAGQPVRFSLAAPDPRPIAHLPTHLAEDSSLWAYAFGEPGHLWASPDGGATWQDRVVDPAGRVLSLTAAAADARVL
jgi:hypothetical protein